ncbi:MAG: hypothetical protein KatS3mg119_1649 [Rhodothalassiaceae bacterium]|nr:MAG: hypothetical protein KatS3mg119_1649 [Rhodothalassiaceae bacterium]
MTMAAPPKPSAVSPEFALLMPGAVKTGEPGDGIAGAAGFLGLLEQLLGPGVPARGGTRGDALPPDGAGAPGAAAALAASALPGAAIPVLAPETDDAPQTAGDTAARGAAPGADIGAPPLKVTAALAVPAGGVQPLAMRPLPLMTVTPGDPAPSPERAPATPGKMEPPPVDPAARPPAALPEVALDAPIATASGAASSAAGLSLEPVPPAAPSPAVAMPAAPAPMQPEPFAQPLPPAASAAATAEQPAAGDPGPPQGGMTRPLPAGTAIAPVPAPQDPVPHMNGEVHEEPASEPAPARAGEAGAHRLAADALNPVNLMKTAEAGLVLASGEASPRGGEKPTAGAPRPGEAAGGRRALVTAFPAVQPVPPHKGGAADGGAPRLGLAQGAGRSDGPPSHFAPTASGHETAAGHAPRAIAGASATPAEAAATSTPRPAPQMPAAPATPTVADPQPLPQSLAAALDPARMGPAAERIEMPGLLQAAQAGAGLERAATAQPAAAPQPAPQAGLPPAAQQLGLALQYRVGRGETRFALRLDPPELGRIEVALKLHSDGRVDALVKAEHGHTLDLLQRDARILERAFHQLGLKPEGGIQFTTGQGSQHHGQQAFAEGGLSGQHHGNGQPAARENAAAMAQAPAGIAPDAPDDMPAADAAGAAMREAVIGVDVKV